MKTCVLCAALGFTLVMPSLVAQSSGTTQPIPEEARKHFVMGATFFKDARTPDDYAQVESEFKQATDLAPQWPDARYNLALAREAAGDYAGAIADLKLYLQFKLSDADARAAQDKIYALEAKQEKAADAAKANSQEAKLAAFMKSLDGGVWRCEHSSFIQSNNGSHWVDGKAGNFYISINGNVAYGRIYNEPPLMRNGYVIGQQTGIVIPYDQTTKPSWTVTLNAPSQPAAGLRFSAPMPLSYGLSDATSYDDEYTISNDGQTIIENQTTVMSWGNVTGTANYVRIR